MKSFFSLLIVCVSLGLISCHNENKFTPAETIYLNAAQLCKLGDLGILDPEEITYCDSLLILKENTDENFIKILTPDNHILFEYGMLGKGPAEFLVPTNVQPFIGNDTLYLGVYDDGNSSYNILKILNISERQITQTRIFESELFFDNIIKMKDEYILSPIADSGYLWLFDGKTLLDKNKDFPVKKDNIPLITHGMACTGILKASLDENIFAKSVFYNGGIQVFEIDHHKIRPLWEFTVFNMDYSVGKHNAPIPNDESRYGYMSMCFSDKYLYALYSGMHIKNDDGDPSASNEIHVFDFKGNHIKKYITDKPVNMIAVNQDHLLTCIGNIDGEPYLIKYALENIK